METTIQQLTENAKVAFKNADTNGKKLLSDLFGENLLPLKITDRIKTWEDVCKHMQCDPVDSLPFESPDNEEEEAINAYFKIRSIVYVLNEGWFPDWDNTSQYKYYPWFYMDSKAGSGFGLSFGGCAYGGSDSNVGSRLCFKSEELAKYAATQFANEYRDFMKK
jgi:nitrite reductase/ring-hydroxylating ferredoxin subunit